MCHHPKWRLRDLEEIGSHPGEGVPRCFLYYFWRKVLSVSI